MWTPAQIARPWLRRYQPGVPAEPRIPVLPLTWLLDDAAARHPKRTALIFFDRKISYRTLQEQVDRCAAGLRRLGVRPGDRVALVLPNCPQHVIALFAVLRLGAIAVPHNPLYTEAELRHQLADCGARVVIVLDNAYAAVRQAGRSVPLDHVVVTSLLDYLPLWQQALLRLPIWELQRRRSRLRVDVPSDPSTIDFTELLAGPARDVPQAQFDPVKHPAAIQYTGGTEGRPKGAVLTHYNLLANAYQGRSWDVEREEGAETALAVLPLFHSFGLAMSLTLPMAEAGTVILLHRFDRDQVVKVLRRYRPTIFPGVPMMYDQLLETPGLKAKDLRSLRACVSGGIELGAATVERFRRFGIEHVLLQGYGLTEAAPSVTCNPLDGNARNSTVGLPLPMTDVVVVDPEEPTLILPVGSPGELVIRGPQVFAGYWNQPLATGEVLSKGWLRTGDIGLVDPDGYVTILERKREMIKSSGFSVFPSEVEDVLRRHPAVFDCAVIGVPDTRRGERIIAWVVEHPAYPFSAEELRRHCEKFLTHYKVPDEFRPRDGLPRNVLGKVIRRALREEHVQASS